MSRLPSPTLESEAPRSSLGVAGAGGALALLPAVAAPTAVAAGLPGAVALLVGVSRGRRRWVRAGAVGLYLGVLIAGLNGAPALLLAVGTVGAVVAWDGAEQTVDVGSHLGAAARGERPIVIHTAITTGVVLVAAVGSYLLYRLAAIPGPTIVVVVLLAGALVLHQVLVRSD